MKTTREKRPDRVIRQYRYKCTQCGDYFKRVPFGYKDYHAICNKCFDLLIKRTHQ